MPRSLRYDEPYLLDERAASPIRHSGIRWGIGLVRFRRDLGIRLGVREGRQSTRLSRSPRTSRTAGVGHLERFPPERVSGRCQIGQETSAGAYSGDGIAPRAVIR